MGTSELYAGNNPGMDWHLIQGGVEILPVPSCYRNRDKLWPDGPLGSYPDFTEADQPKVLESAATRIQLKSMYFSYIPKALCDSS